MKAGIYVPRTTIEHIRADKPEMIYYGAQSCWWTHRDQDLRFHENGIPCDPTGGVLLQSDNPEYFLAQAEENPEHYGKHGLRAFMASHNDNCQESKNRAYHFVVDGWDEYNRLLDEYDEFISLWTQERALLHEYGQCLNEDKGKELTELRQRIINCAYYQTGKEAVVERR